MSCRTAIVFVGKKPAPTESARWACVVSAIAHAVARTSRPIVVLDDGGGSLAEPFVEGFGSESTGSATASLTVHAPETGLYRPPSTPATDAIRVHCYADDGWDGLSVVSSVLDRAALVVVLGGDGAAACVARVARGRGLPVWPLATLGGAASEMNRDETAPAPLARTFTIATAARDAELLVEALVAVPAPAPVRSYFLSYAHLDGHLADEVENFLRRHGRRVLRDETAFRAGQPLESEIRENIAMADDVVVIDSAAALASAWVMREIAVAAVMQARRKDAMRIVGLLAEGHPPRTALDPNVIHVTGTTAPERQLAVWNLVDREPSAVASGPVGRVPKRITAMLTEWPRTFADGTTLPRPELGAILGIVRDDDPATVLVLGSPGSGKSALLAELAATLDGAGNSVIALKVDRLPKTVNSLDALSAWAGVPSLVASIRAAAAQRRTVLLVDQLDALGALADVESDRLAAVIDLIADVDGIPNVHVVASCRAFEFRHDTRFARLQAKEINLALPTWEDVRPVLTRAGHAPDLIPPRLRELLLVPQHLKVFLRTGTASAAPDTYEAMLETLWRDRVVGDATRVELVRRAARLLAEDEEALVPAAIADGSRQALDELVAAGVLHRDGTGIGFTHQTLFEYAHARAFTQDSDGLDSHVLRRQDALFVRPVLWTGLRYLRGARPAEYRRVYTRLAQGRDTRQHIRVLLAEFLGQLEGPRDEEVLWFERLISDRLLRRAAIGAMTGSRTWFGVLKRTLFPSLLDAPEGNEFAGVLNEAATTDQAHVVSVLRAYAHRWPNGDNVILFVLRNLERWDDDAIALAEDVIRRVTDRSDLDGLLSAVADREPAAAVRILGTTLSTRIERAIASTSPDDDSWRSPRAQALIDALGFSDAIVDWSAVAATIPGVFAQVIMPAVVRALDAGISMQRKSRAFAVDFISDHLDDGASRLLCAVETSLKLLAATEPRSLDALLPILVASNAMTAHRLVARTLAEWPVAERASVVATYLLGDPRRWRIGARSESDGATLDLLRAAATHFSTSETGALEAAILQHVALAPSRQSDPVRRRWELLRWNREEQGRLLAVLRFEDLSVPARDRVRDHRLHAREPHDHGSSEFTEIRSSMSAEQMAHASDNDILHLFAILTDDTMRRHPKRVRLGGTIQASRELAKLAEQHGDRLARLVVRFHAGTQETPVGEVLASLAKAGWSPDAWERLVLDADGRGFSKPTFRDDIAMGIMDHAKARRGASDALVTMLLRWLVVPPAPADEEPRRVSIARPATVEKPINAEPRPILSGFGGGIHMWPDGTFRVCRALFAALMFREPPDVARWLAILEAHLDREDSVAVWEGLALELPALWRLDDRARVERFLDTLWTRHPALLETVPNALLLANSISWLTRGCLTRCLCRLQGSSAPFARQLAGELGVYAALRGLVDVGPETRMIEGSVDERIGIAFAAVNAWTYEKHRLRTTQILLTAIRDADAAPRRAALEVFSLREELPNDRATATLLDELVTREIYGIEVPDNVCSLLPSLLPIGAGRALAVAHAFLGAIEAGHRSWHGTDPGSALADLAVTLQRLQPYREAGVELFERLQRLGAYGVGDVLFDLDGQIQKKNAPLPRTRRFPRKATARGR